MEEQTVFSAPLRLARRLVGMPEGYGLQSGQGGTRRVLAVTQQELALMIGVSRQTTNQILKELEAQGILQVQRGGWKYWICRDYGRCRDRAPGYAPEATFSALILLPQGGQTELCSPESRGACRNAPLSFVV